MAMTEYYFIPLPTIIHWQQLNNIANCMIRSHNLFGLFFLLLLRISTCCRRTIMRSTLSLLFPTGSSSHWRTPQKMDDTLPKSQLRLLLQTTVRLSTGGCDAPADFGSRRVCDSCCRTIAASSLRGGMPHGDVSGQVAREVAGGINQLMFNLESVPIYGGVVARGSSCHSTRSRWIKSCMLVEALASPVSTARSAGGVPPRRGNHAVRHRFTAGRDWRDSRGKSNA
jgi:hypothetical protein